jgi:Protein of unknown function (DUF3102)
MPDGDFSSEINPSVVSQASLDKLAEHAAEIRRLGKQTIENVVEIGRRYAECRAILKEDGKWRAWLKDEFNGVESSARNFINVFEMSKSTCANFAHVDLPVSALYLIAAPSTPDAARTEIIERAAAGERYPVAAAKRTIEAAKGRQHPDSAREVRRVVETAKGKPAKTKAQTGAAEAIEPRPVWERLLVETSEVPDLQWTALFTVKGFDWYLRTMPLSYLEQLQQLLADGQGAAQLKSISPDVPVKHSKGRHLKLVQTSEGPTAH